MRTPLDPGPPLTAEPEYCPDDLPTGLECARGAFIATMAALLGGGLQLTASLLTHRVWGLTTVLVGLGIGVAVYFAAGRHRSRKLGLIASGATLLSAAMGYGLTWLPLVDPAISRTADWYYLIMLGLGLFIAYQMAGPRPGAADEEGT